MQSTQPIPVVLTLTEHDVTALNGLAKGNMSFVVREMVADYDVAKVSEFVNVKRKSFRLDDQTMSKLAEDATRLKTTVPTLVRAIIESKLQTQH